MTKKKKISIAVILCVVLILGSFGIYAYQKQVQVEREKVYQVYRWIPTKEYGDKNPLDLGVTVKELKKNPPAIEMNGRKGLYISVMAYNHATGNSIDYENIKELMEQGNPSEVYENYNDYLAWYSTPSSGKTGLDYRNAFISAVTQIAVKNGVRIDPYNPNYEDYKKIIEMYPDEIDAFLNR